MKPVELALRIVVGDIKPQPIHLSALAPNEPTPPIPEDPGQAAVARALVCKRVRDLAFKCLVSRLDFS